MQNFRSEKLEIKFDVANVAEWKEVGLIFHFATSFAFNLFSPTIIRGIVVTTYNEFVSTVSKYYINVTQRQG